VLEVPGFTIDEASTARVMGALRENNRSARTRNQYLRIIKSFTAWMARKRYIPFDPLSDTYLERASSDPRHTRTAFSEERLARLITVTEASPFYWGRSRISGKDRAEIYHAAAATGVRAGTLAKLIIAQFHLDDAIPCLKTRADQEKGKRGRTIPLQAASAERLRNYFAGRSPEELAFRMPKSYQVVRMLRSDLQSAGIPYCVKVLDEAGKCQQRIDVLDFHALRHTYGTRLMRAGVQPRVAQDLMGHSDINLTMKIYSHVAIEDSAAAVARVPALPSASTPAKPLDGLTMGARPATVAAPVTITPRIGDVVPYDLSPLPTKRAG
jgi:integrase